VTFTVAPDTATPTVYTVEASAADGETIPENNRRSILVNPAGRKRRVLFVAGAPGFDHSFLLRALGDDPGLEVDSVVRKGKNDDGRDTFVVQADASRAPKLAPGLPSKHEDLFAYDAIVLANYEGDGFTRAQLEAASQFVSERGGGLLMLGGRSFVQRGLAGTALESVLPVDLSDRRGQAGRSSYPMIRGAQLHAVSITPEGADHPVMRIGASREETEKRWAALPPLASNAPLGGPRPGASVLAVTTDQSGVYPLVAVQRFGRGRAMVFGGEASWRWQMLMPATDRSYERFWRQAVRWLAGPAPDPVSITVPDELEEGTAAVLHVDARDAAFVPAADAAIDATLTGPDGASTTLALKHDPTGYSATTALGRAGLYRLHVDARQGTASLGSADRWFLAGSGEQEFADPRLNEGVLRRLARTSGGRYVPIAEASRVAAWLSDAVPPADTAARRDIWNQPWVLGAIVSLLAAEWILRRRWGLH
ncbi:MAG TPA: glutamine amidotransferase, partial [Vicinamibacterales bacterium]|nr:glutamine amidotransferase [Vicinamibacterales bacterium]